MYTKSILAATFAALAAAAPTARQSSQVIYLITTHSGSTVHLQSVAENGLKFWIGKETSTYCPSTVETCPTGTETQFLAAESSSNVAMNVVVPGGQRVYVAGDASLSVTAPHSSSTGTGGLLSGFSYTAPSTEGNGRLVFNGESFTACPSGADVYQIFALGYPGYIAPADCISVNLLAFVADSDPVWEYV